MGGEDRRSWIWNMGGRVVDGGVAAAAEAAEAAAAMQLAVSSSQLVSSCYGLWVGLVMVL